MSATAHLIARNAIRRTQNAHEELDLVPKLRTVIITCADHRVDPAHTLGLALGEAAVVRNAGGRITPAALQTVAMMATAVAAEGRTGGFELILLQHTDCGIARLKEHADLLASYFEVSVDALPEKHVADPVAAVQGDVALLRSNPALPDDLCVSGLVYDVKTGEVRTVVSPATLRG
jgi:carbonic anhydrase